MVPKGIRRTMILLLIIMTPGIPEYMTGSSRLGDLLFNSPSFFLGLAFNIALYSCGALLIREFSIKFHKGWASILILGLAYGIMEEGISVHTFFIPSGSPPGILAIYGRYLGVDWIWALGISVFHAIFSIGLPILLLSIAYPKYSREPLLSKKNAAFVLFIYSIDVLVLNIVANRYSSAAIPTGGDYLFFLALSALLVVIALKLPGKWLIGKGNPEGGMKKFFLLGALAFVLYCANAFLPAHSDGTPRISPLLEALLFVLGNAIIMAAIVKYMPPTNNRRHKFALALGLIIPLFIWAELLQIIGVAYIITAVSIIAVILLLKLRKMVKSGKYTADGGADSASAPI